MKAFLLNTGALDMSASFVITERVSLVFRFTRLNALLALCLHK